MLNKVEQLARFVGAYSNGVAELLHFVQHDVL